jgi:hypothetical protein
MSTPIPTITWREVTPPKTWQPKDGDVIVGYYMGKSRRDGRWGQYEVVVVGVPTGDGFNSPYLISGTKIVQAIDSGNVQPGKLVRVTFKGRKEIGKPDDDGRKHEVKVFVVETADGPDLTIEAVRAYIATLGEVPVEPEPEPEAPTPVITDDDVRALARDICRGAADEVRLLGWPIDVGTAEARQKLGQALGKRVVDQMILGPTLAQMQLARTEAQIYVDTVLTQPGLAQ